MVSSREFKQAIREGRLQDAFVIAMGNAPELHITTWIASAEDSEAQPPQGGCLRTHVNLVEGEIINEIGEKLIGDDLYGSLQQFHLQQVTQGHQTISQNLQSIQQMFRLLAILQKQQNGEKYSSIDTWKIANTSLPPASASQIGFNRQNKDTPTVNTLSAQKSEYLQPIDRDEDSIVEDLLSLDDFEVDIDSSDKDNNGEKGAKKEEDWGDWINEDNSEMDSAMLAIEDLDLDESEDWQEDWEDETEFISNTSIEHNDNNQSQDKPQN